MRYIDNKELLRSISTSKLDDATSTIKKLETLEEKKKFIKQNDSLWSDIKIALWNLGYNKCWYSEAMIELSNVEVEHYRPKNQVCKVSIKNEGYWWLAFNWKNYRISHSICNKRKTDYITLELRGKGNYFPIKDESLRRFDIGCENDEEPLLLDPTNKKDVKLIRFDISNGRPIPTYMDEEDSWKYQRSNESIKYYHLDEGTWNLKRYKIASQINILCKRLESLNPDSPEYDDAITTISEYIKPRAEFTAIAFQVLLEKNLLKVDLLSIIL